MVALAVPALASEGAPWAALAAIGPLVAWWLVAGKLAAHVAGPGLDRALRMRAFYALRERSRPRTLVLALTAVFALLSLALVIFWTLWSPR